MTKQLINLEKSTDGLRVNSFELSEGIEATYKATNNLIRKHKDRLETFGELPFKKALKGSKSRMNTALLNEDQAIFLVTLSRNTEKVVQFKHALVTAFSKLRRKQALIDENHAKEIWQQNRQLGKYQRRDITDSIQAFITYARNQGSQGAQHYYTIITTCVNKALCIESREEVDEEHLHILATAETVAEKVLVQGMAIALPYKTIYQELKTTMRQFKALTQQQE